jgi:hypothetical protein
MYEKKPRNSSRKASRTSRVKTVNACRRVRGIMTASVVVICEDSSFGGETERKNPPLAA